METYKEPVIVNTFTWCLQIPPRCPKTQTEIRQRYRVKTEIKSRDVNECCEGYKVISSDDEETGIRCVPFCEKCLSGVCISPNQCQCIPGYKGDNCDTACPPGTWGSECKEKCNCAEDVSCNPVNGHCVCPPGLRGQMCNESCPGDYWGPECAFPCDCKNYSSNKCHSETGRCIVDDATETRETGNEKNSVAVNFTIHFQINEEESFSKMFENSTEAVGREVFATANNMDRTTRPEETSVSSSDESRIRTQTQEDGNSSTARPVIVLVSVPERRRNLEKDRGKFGLKNTFVRHVGDNGNLHNVVQQPKTDYVKNVHKGTHQDVQPAPIPLDIALIVVASIVSLGLTSVAVAMVLHMRSKLLETGRISIYEEKKSQENLNSTRISSIVTGTLPQTPIRLGPLFTTTLEPRMMQMDNIDPSGNYANGAATIGLRLSGNLHGLLQDDHYDIPPATRIRLQNDFDTNTEHVYAEIPLQSSPLNGRKNA
ncbi:Platelet endothelial aggregation receptor 1 [Habropoda laboriosa]|uniref:Platelet endothelial aggregation receptor 1 n=1 Tax=Habropoda laboriosa TaxID=597456 RepID=A0A0L7QVF6_9HYME|nr:Platelet endothelial aggregation receptor 1 [Habropoda laboriosa]